MITKRSLLRNRITNDMRRSWSWFAMCLFLLPVIALWSGGRAHLKSKGYL
jgi:hypothetical protein